MDMKVRVKLKNLDREVDVIVGQDLRSGLLDNDIEVYDGNVPMLPLPWKLLNCQGHGLCGSCMINIVEGQEGLSPQTLWEKIRVGIFSAMRAKEKGTTFGKPRLACLTRCYQDAVIETMASPAE